MSANWRQAPAWQDEPELHERIQDAIYRVLNYQSSSGSFGLWGPGSGDLWLDAYVTDFLTRAREQDYDVPDAGDEPGADNLQNSLAYDVDLEDRGSEIAYALYVLARNKQGLGRRPALLCRHAARSLLQPDGAWPSSARALRSMAMRSARRRPSTAALQLRQEHDRNTTGTAPTMARSCATARRCWRSPPKAKPMPSVVPELIKLVVGRTRRNAAGPARRTMPGCCLRRAPCRPATPRSAARQSTAQPHTGAYLEDA